MRVATSTTCPAGSPGRCRPRRSLFAALAVLASLCAVPSADAAKLRAPSLAGPSNGARVQQLPAISWGAVRGAATYEYEVSADARFSSLALGKGTGKGVSHTYNLSATLEKTVPDGTYFWRVRAVSAKDKPGAWSRTRKLIKKWSAAPAITGGNGVTVHWPNSPLVLRWSSVPYATKYIVSIATDPTLSNLVMGSAARPVETQGTAFAVPISLAPGHNYYWAVTPVDAEGRRGQRSSAGFFTWEWNSATSTQLTDLDPEAGIFADPMYSWAPVPGAARYEVEVNSDEHFAPGSKWCCSGATTATSLAPLQALANNRYYWRVRAIDARGDVGTWNVGQPFEKTFDPRTPTISNLTVRNADGAKLTGVPATDTPIVTWDPVPGASLYEVQLGLYKGGLGCDFSIATSAPRLTFATATTAWTPLHGAGRVGPSEWPSPERAVNVPANGTTYCIRVLARTDEDAQHNQVISAWTQINGVNHAAFTYSDSSAESETVNKQEETEEEKGERASCVATRRPLIEEGEWKAGATYLKNAVVADKSGARYLSLASENKGHEPIASPGYWYLLTLSTPACAYRLPINGTSTTLTPLLTWKRVALARGYYVVISRDARFTEVADVGFTTVPAYAPELANEVPLSDETTSYYWAVIPTGEPDGSEVFSSPCYPTLTNPCEGANDNPQVFNKASDPPQLQAPADGAQLESQPTFRWTRADNARTYEIQVSQDASFGKPLEDVKTNATAYASSVTYPTGTPLYWRVRATDWHGQGLSWSSVRSFVRTLATPTLSPPAPTTVFGPAPLSWTPITGAIGYDLRIEQGTGKSEEFQLEAPSASFVKYHGAGLAHLQVRAEFPTSTGSKVAGPFSGMQSSLLILPAPAHVRGTRKGSKLLLSWSPEPDARQYQVEVSTTSGFHSRLESHRVDGTEWAPNLDLRRKQLRGTLYWRVAPVDVVGGVGSYAAGTFGAPSSHKVRCTKSKHKRSSHCKKH
jgi:hypothetical protein